MRKAHALLFFFLWTSQFVLAQSIQESMVIDAETKRPVQYASIGIVGSAKGTSSNLNGQFSLHVPDGATIRISCLGYKTVDVAAPLPEIIYLYPVVTQLQEIIVTNKKINANVVVSRAFRYLKQNTIQQSFNQTFFYRHYCKDNNVYGRLIEASVEVYKLNGYKFARSKPGEKEGIRVNQLRRSFDKTVFAMGHVPIAVSSILESDLNAYRRQDPIGKIDFFSEVSNIQYDIGLYTFKFAGITVQDNEEVYVIEFESNRDSVQTTTGYTKVAHANGKYFITVNTYAFVKTEVEKILGADTIQTKTYYKKHDGYYYPYHISRSGKSYSRDGSTHFYNIEFVSTDIQTKNPVAFEGKEPGRFQLLTIPYDSAFWNSMSLLKTTPIEDKIIYDLGGGKSLAEQFYIYQLEQIKVLNAGKNGDEGFDWLVGYDFKKPKYVAFWRSACQPCIEELKNLFRNETEDVYMISVSVDRDSANWTKALKQLNWKNSARVKHIWLGNLSDVVEKLKVNELPKYMWYDKNGNVVIRDAAKPSSSTWRDQVNKLANK